MRSLPFNPIRDDVNVHGRLPTRLVRRLIFGHFVGPIKNRRFILIDRRDRVPKEKKTPVTSCQRFLSRLYHD